MASYLITGASRGIGIELTKQLLALPASQAPLIIATSRGAADGQLASLLGSHSDRLAHVRLAVDSDSSAAAAASEVDALLAKRGFAGLDVLVNNAGIGSYEPNGLKAVTSKDFASVLDTNVIGVHRVTSALIPSLEKGKEKKIINVSSAMGSVTRAREFFGKSTYAYNVSKTALSGLTAQYALEYETAGFTVLSLSPGWLKTELGSEYADLPVEVGVASVLDIILKANPAQNGQFLDIKVPGQYAYSYPGGQIAF